MRGEETRNKEQVNLIKDNEVGRVNQVNTEIRHQHARKQGTTPKEC